MKCEKNSSRSHVDAKKPELTPARHRGSFNSNGKCTRLQQTLVDVPQRLANTHICVPSCLVMMLVSVSRPQIFHHMRCDRTFFGSRQTQHDWKLPDAD
jgi:hypothetical protein